MLTFVRGFYRWIVLDLGRLSVLSLSLLDKIDSMFLVTGTTVPALFEAKRVMGGLRRAGIDAERILLIVNQLANTPEFSSSELQQIFGKAPYAKLPDASPEFRDVRMQGRLPSENGVFRENIARLARRVAGLPEEESRHSLSQFLSFGGKIPPCRNCRARGSLNMTRDAMERNLLILLVEASAAEASLTRAEVEQHGGSGSEHCRSSAAATPPGDPR